MQPQKDMNIDHLDILMFFPIVPRPESAIFSLISSLIINCLRSWMGIFSWMKQANRKVFTIFSFFYIIIILELTFNDLAYALKIMSP